MRLSPAVLNDISNSSTLIENPNSLIVSLGMIRNIGWRLLLENHKWTFGREFCSDPKSPHCLDQVFSHMLQGRLHRGACERIQIAVPIVREVASSCSNG